MNTGKLGFMRWALWIVIGVIAAITWHYKYDDWGHALFVI